MQGEFLDANVLVYAFTTDPRAAAAQALLGRGCVTGVQALNEFTNVARRKLGMTWAEVGEALNLTTEQVLEAMEAASAYDAVSLESYRFGDEGDGETGPGAAGEPGGAQTGVGRIVGGEGVFPGEGDGHRLGGTNQLPGIRGGRAGRQGDVLLQEPAPVGGQDGRPG